MVMFSYFNFNKNQMMLGLAFNIQYSINCIDKGKKEKGRTLFNFVKWRDDATSSLL